MCPLSERKGMREGALEGQGVLRTTASYVSIHSLWSSKITNQPDGTEPVQAHLQLLSAGGKNNPRSETKKITAHVWQIYSSVTWWKHIWMNKPFLRTGKENSAHFTQKQHRKMHVFHILGNTSPLNLGQLLGFCSLFHWGCLSWRTPSVGPREVPRQPPSPGD